MILPPHLWRSGVKRPLKNRRRRRKTTPLHFSVGGKENLTIKITRPGTFSSLLTDEARRRSTHTRPQRPSHWQNQLPPSFLFNAADFGHPQIRSPSTNQWQKRLFWDLHQPSWQTVPPVSVLLLPSHASCAGGGGGDAGPRPSKKDPLLRLTVNRLGRGQKKHNARWRQNSAWHTNICFLNCKH